MLMSSEGAVPYVAAVPDYEIVDETMFISSGDWRMCMALRTFEKGMAKAAAVIAKHRLRQAEVVPIRRGRGHAAT